jgi:predicted nucleic acid-binding protein
MFLIDTNVLSELPRAKPDRNVVAWFELLPEFAISPITLEELRYGVAKVTGKKAVPLRTWLDALLASSPRIVPVDETIALAAGELRAERERRGRPVAQADMLIAATSIVTGLTLATRNTSDFDGCGIAMINPFRR